MFKTKITFFIQKMEIWLTEVVLGAVRRGKSFNVKSGLK